MNMKSMMSGGIGLRGERVAIAFLLLAVLLASCAPAPTPVQPTAIPPTAVPPTAAAPAASTEVVDPTYTSSIPVAVVPEGEPGKPMIVAAYNTTIRGGPGTNYVVYGAFLGSASAIAVGISTDSQWYAISVPVAPGGTGWVSAVYSLPQGTEGLPVLPSPPVPPTIAMVPPQPGEPQATALTDVYLRTGPGDTYPAYGIATTGATARVIGKSQDGAWLVVRLDPTNVGIGYGWAAAAFVQASNIESVTVVTSPDLPPAVVFPPPASGLPTAVALDYVNLRSGPGANYLIYGVASPGAAGEVVGKSQDAAWWQVKVPVEKIAAGVAWVSAGWVSTVNTESVPVVAAPAPPPTDISTTPPAATQCALVGQDPADNTSFPVSYGFGMSWVLKNTSTTPWDQNQVDLVFQGAKDGVRLHQNFDLYDITTTVLPGETYTVSGGLITPAQPGQYGEAWALQQGNNVLCTFWVLVNAQ